MPTYKNLPRGKQKPKDEFVNWTVHALIWIKNNWQTALELVGVAVVAFTIVIGASNYWQYRSQKASQALYGASRVQVGSEEQINKLEEVASDYSRTPSGQNAMMQLGGIYLEKKDYDKALEKFKMLAGRSRNHPILNVAALHRMADVLIAKGDYSAASETYLKAAADPHNLLSDLSRYRAALCLEKAGDLEKATNLYRQVIKDTETADDRAVRDLSEERLLWLTVNRKI